MSTTIVWLMVIFSPGPTWSTGPEFTSKEKCEAAAQVLFKSVEGLSWSRIRKPICVKIEK